MDEETAEERAAYIESGDPNTSGPNGEHVPEWTTCGTCGRTWDDARITGVTPAPSGRCPFEWWHEAEEDVPAQSYRLTEHERRIVADALALAAESWSEWPEQGEDVENVATARALAGRFATED